MTRSSRSSRWYTAAAGSAIVSAGSSNWWSWASGGSPADVRLGEPTEADREHVLQDHAECEVRQGHHQERRHGRQPVEPRVDAGRREQRPGDRDDGGDQLGQHEQHRGAGQAFGDEVRHRGLAVARELHPHVARGEVAEPPDIAERQWVVEVVLLARRLDACEPGRRGVLGRGAEDVEQRVAEHVHRAERQRADRYEQPRPRARPGVRGGSPAPQVASHALSNHATPLWLHSSGTPSGLVRPQMPRTSAANALSHIVWVRNT